MLRSLTIRNVVLIAKLDLAFEAGLGVLTGETGSGKSILLDALGLALGARADTDLVSAGAEQGSAIAEFELDGAPAIDQLLADNDLADEGALVLRRSVSAGGRSRAFVNDRPVSATLLRQIGEALVEIHGQLESHGLLDAASHVKYVDAFGGNEKLLQSTVAAYDTWQDADAARLADVDFILHAEHGSNASSFAARVTVGTEANLHGAVVTALATLAGPAHGGAAEDVMKMVMEIGTPDKAADYVKAKRGAREPVTGFGHRVYRAEDPRARHMREGVRKLGQEMGAPEWYEILQGVVDAMKPYARHGLNVNVDFYSGVVYQLHGIPMDLYVPIFAIGRMPGWIIQCLEQQRGNILIRPLTLYNGPEMRPFKTLETR